MMQNYFYALSGNVFQDLRQAPFFSKVWSLPSWANFRIYGSLLFIWLFDSWATSRNRIKQRLQTQLIPLPLPFRLLKRLSHPLRDTRK